MMSASSNAHLGARRVVAYASVALAIQCLTLIIWIVRYYALHDRSSPMVGSDFSIFWSAARVALEHGPAAVFTSQWILPIEATLRPTATFAPWPYPPTFLLVVLSFGLLPFGAALIAFSAFSIVTYGAVIVRLARRLDRALFLPVAAFPGIFVAIDVGQNSLITAAAAGGALALLESDSMVAGACVAILVIKPQLGILFPLALICGRQWKALAVSTICSVAFVGISAAALGREAWIAFASFVPEFNRLAVEHGTDLWRMMPTVFAACRLAGLSVDAAYVVHALVAIPAAAATAYLWMRPARFDLRAAALIIATLLVQPYLMFYDLAWLALPIIFLMRDANAAELSRSEWAILGAAWLIPAQGFLAILLGVPWQLAPAVLIVLLVMVMRRDFAAQS